MDSQWDMPIYVPKRTQQVSNQPPQKQQQGAQVHSANKQFVYVPKDSINTEQQKQPSNVSNLGVQKPQKDSTDAVIQKNKAASLTSAKSPLRFFDVAANLGSSQFSGVYKGKKVHDSDIKDVISRAENVGCDHLLLSASNLKDSKDCLKISELSKKFFTTVGLHPAKANDADKDMEKYFQNLESVIIKAGSKCVAVGECGLDYDRLFCSPKETQIRVFEAHFALAEKYKLPLYLHSRNAREDFLRIIKANRKRFSTGLVHCYTGGLEELQELINEGMYFSVNAYAFKEQKDFEVVKKIPLDRIMIETDAPFGRVKKGDAGYALLTSDEPVEVAKEKYARGSIVKGRNEPCFVTEVNEMLAAVLGKDEHEIARICFENSLRFFNITE